MCFHQLQTCQYLVFKLWTKRSRHGKCFQATVDTSHEDGALVTVPSFRLKLEILRCAKYLNETAKLELTKGVTMMAVPGTYPWIVRPFHLPSFQGFDHNRRDFQVSSEP